MKQHPSQEQWMEFLYDEIEVREKQAIEKHLESCAPCRETRARLSDTREGLDVWEATLPPRHRLAGGWFPWVKWAAAAAVLVTTAFATGRFSRLPIDVAELRSEIAKPLREELSRELNAQLAEVRARSEKAVAEALAVNKQQVEQLARTVASLREEDRRAVYASLQELEAQQAGEYRRLRQNLETVAVLTDQSLKDAQRQLIQLAGYNTPVSHTQ
jgi:hypothetical protein